MVGLKLNDLVGQTLGVEPGSEPAHVPRVSRLPVPQWAVGLQLGLESGRAAVMHDEGLGPELGGRGAPGARDA
jgi:hypothetical protein